MDDEARRRFEAIEQLVSTVAQEGRKDRKDLRRSWRHHRQFINIFTIAFTLFGAGFATLVGFIHNTDVGERTAYETNLRNELLNKTGETELKILDYDGHVLDGKNVVVRIYREPPQPKDWAENNISPYPGFGMVIQLVLRNEGNFPSGSMLIKTYTNDPFVTDYKSADEKAYEYESFASAAGGGAMSMNLAGQLSMTERLKFGLFKFPKKGTYPVLMKLYYGNGKIAHATFDIIVDQDTPALPLGAVPSSGPDVLPH
jgi:hypothetical protein